MPRLQLKVPPAIQLVIDEALGAGIDHIVVVSSRSKPALEA